MKIRPPGARWPGRTTRLLLLTLPALLMAMHTLYWQWLSHALNDGVHAWMARRIAAGWRIETGPPVTGGWPFVAKLTLPNPAVTAPDHAGWTADNIVLQVSLLHPDHLLVDAPGSQRLTLGSGTRIDFTAGRLHLDIPLARADATVEFHLSATGITLPSSLAPSLTLSFGSPIASLSATGRIRFAVDFSEAGLTTQARQWRDRGGSIELSQAALLWGPLDLSGEVMLTLDDRLQPKGDARARITGFADTIARLAETRSIPPQAAMLATAALTMMSGSSGTAEVPLHLQAGRLSIGPMPLLAVPDLEWPSR